MEGIRRLYGDYMGDTSKYHPKSLLRFWFVLKTGDYPSNFDEEDLPIN